MGGFHDVSENNIATSWVELRATSLIIIYLNSSYVATFWFIARNFASFSLSYFWSAFKACCSSFRKLLKLMSEDIYLIGIGGIWAWSV